MNTAQLFAVLAASTMMLVTPMLASSPQECVEEDLPVAEAVMNFGNPDHLVPGPLNHILVPCEVTIFKGGTVTFRMNGPAHGIAIYPVSKHTTREDIAEDLCQGGPASCNGVTATGRLGYTITDGKGDVIVVIDELQPGTPATPINYEPGQMVSAGAGSFLPGTSSTVPAGTAVRVRFEKGGRYLVLCMNRPHTINDWMFGFVNVTVSAADAPQ